MRDKESLGTAFPLDQYTLAKSFDKYNFYIPRDMDSGYHLSRYIEVQRQSIYASSGATPEVLERSMDVILDLCNKNGDVGHRFTDIASVANMLKYRLSYPVDEHCSVRVGATLCFIEWEEGGQVYSENPDRMSPFYTNKKVDLAMMDSDVYAFFLTLGIANIEKYKGLSSILEDEDYFSKRKEVLMSLCRIV